MKTTENISQVRISGISNAGVAFGIKEDGLAHIFNVLRNQLYSNKILAVIREYSCNAHDAHVESGNKSSIVVTCPTLLTPNFSVRDYGFGLSTEQIQEVFAFYGESTKRQSNALIGQLGLGSKSGFAYGDNFIINSTYRGIRYSYNAYIDESKKGKIALINEESTEEHSGVEIVIPVRPRDVSVFESTILSFFKYFEPKPILVDIDIEKIKTAWGKNPAIISGEGWAYYAPTESGWRAGAVSDPTVLVMGNIAYPLDVSAVDGLQDVFGSGFVVHFSIGDLEVAASREGLQYSHSTQSAIKKRFDSIAKEIRSVVKARIDNAKSISEARAIYGDTMEMGGQLYLLRAVINGSRAITWNGHTINDSDICSPTIFKGVYLYELVRSGRSDRIVSKKCNRINISCSSTSRLYLDDVGGKCMCRLGHYVFERSKTNIHKVYVISFDNDKVKADWLSSVGMKESDLKTASSEPKRKIVYEKDGETVPVIKNAKHNSTAAFVMSSHSSSWLKVKSDGFVAENFDLEQGGVFIHIDKFYVNPTKIWAQERAVVESREFTNLMFPQGDLKDQFSKTKCLIEFPKVACFKSDSVSKIESNPKWKHFSDFLAEWTAENWKNGQAQKLTDYIHVRDFVKNTGHKEVMVVLETACTDELLAFKKKFHDMNHASMDSIAKVFEGSRTISHVAAPSPSFDLGAEYKSILDKYPIYNCLNEWLVLSSKTKLDAVKRYISADLKAQKDS
jgi:hypothetical protein